MVGEIEVTEIGEIFERNLGVYFAETNPNFSKSAFDHLVSVTSGTLVTAGFPEFMVRRYKFSFRERSLSLVRQGQIEDDVRNLMTQALKEKFGPRVAEKIQLTKRPLNEIYSEETRADLQQIRTFWQGNDFLIPVDSETSRVADYEDVYMLKALKRKGNIPKKEEPYMREHNRKVLTLLKELGWEGPYTDPNDLD